MGFSKFIVFFSAVVFFQHSHGQRHEVGLLLGSTNYIGEVGETTFINPSFKAPSATLLYRSNFSPRFTLRTELGVSRIRGVDTLSSEPLRQERANSFTNTLLHASTILEVNYFNIDQSGFDFSWAPYMFVGLSFLGYQDLYYPTNTTIAYNQTRDFTFAIPVGVGIKTRLGTNFLIGVEVKALYTFSDNLDGSFPTFVNEIDQRPAFGNRLSNDWVIYSGLSMTYSFGRGWFIRGLL
jgi:hypothetical protein